MKSFKFRSWIAHFSRPIQELDYYELLDYLKLLNRDEVEIGSILPASILKRMAEQNNLIEQRQEVDYSKKEKHSVLIQTFIGASTFPFGLLLGASNFKLLNQLVTIKGVLGFFFAISLFIGIFATLSKFRSLQTMEKELFMQVTLICIKIKLLEALGAIQHGFMEQQIGKITILLRKLAVPVRDLPVKDAGMEAVLVTLGELLPYLAKEHASAYSDILEDIYRSIRAAQGILQTIDPAAIGLFNAYKLFGYLKQTIPEREQRTQPASTRLSESAKKLGQKLVYSFLRSRQILETIFSSKFWEALVSSGGVFAGSVGVYYGGVVTWLKASHPEWLGTLTGGVASALVIGTAALLTVAVAWLTVRQANMVEYRKNKFKKLQTEYATLQQQHMIYISLSWHLEEINLHLYRLLLAMNSGTQVDLSTA